MRLQSPRSTRRFWLLWLPTFLGFPLGGLAASLIVGPVQTPLQALAGGAVAGLVIGLAQWLALRTLYGTSPLWIIASSLGLSLGLALGVAVFGTATDTPTLVARGFVTGLGVGTLQALTFYKTVPRPLWTLAVALLWAAGWPLTGLVIAANLGNDYAVFGASGAVFFTLLSGLALLALRRR